MERISRESFIRLGAALGVGAATASLAACGGGSEGGSSGGSSGNSGGGASQAAASSAGGDTTMMSAPAEETTMMGSSGGSGAAIAQESEVAPGSAVKFKDGGQDAVLVHLDDGNFVAYSAVCTHAGCTVAYRNNQLACPCHGSIFDPANGAEVVSGPAQRPLPEIPVEVQNGEIVKA